MVIFAFMLSLKTIRNNLGIIEYIMEHLLLQLTIQERKMKEESSPKATIWNSIDNLEFSISPCVRISTGCIRIENNLFVAYTD